MRLLVVDLATQRRVRLPEDLAGDLRLLRAASAVQARADFPATVCRQAVRRAGASTLPAALAPLTAKTDKQLSLRAGHFLSGRLFAFMGRASFVNSQGRIH